MRVLSVFFFAFLVVALFWSCRPDGDAVPPLVFTRDSIVAKSDFCGQDSLRCTTARALLPVAFGGPPGVSERINDTLEHYASRLIGFEGEENEDDFRLAIRNFVDEYDRFIREFDEDYTVAWMCDLVGSILYQSDSLVSIRLDQVSYSGGAHPNSVTLLFNFQTRNGQLITFGDVLSDRDAFARTAERFFRKSRELGDEEDLTDAGFFWDGRFELPDNFALTESGVLLFYNSYEVAPYSLGPTEYTIPYAELSGALQNTGWIPKG